MAYNFDDPDDEAMGDLALSEHIESDGIEFKENQFEDLSMDAFDIYDSYYE